MRGSGGTQTQGGATASILGAALILAALIGVGTGVAEQRGGATRVFAASTGDDSEREKTLPIRRPSRRNQKVVMSLGPGRLPTLEAADRLLATAELQLSTTCIEPSRRCIGRPYRYSPKMTAHIVIARGRRRENGERISSIDSKKCHQPLPHRNHHCVLVLRDGAKEVGSPADLPCNPGDCYVNVVASAVSRRARRGNVVIVGEDTPSGGIRQDKGRLDAAVLRGPGIGDPAGHTEQLIKRRVPVADSGQGGLRVIYSLPFDDLRSGDAYRILARQTTKIHHLPYNVFIGSQLVLAGERNAVNPSRRARRTAALAQITEGNGFNCTRGNSAYESPCVTRKVGLLEIRRDTGRRLYVNLVANAFPKRANPGANDAALALHDGFLDATRYRDPD